MIKERTKYEQKHYELIQQRPYDRDVRKQMKRNKVDVHMYILLNRCHLSEKAHKHLVIINNTSFTIKYKIFI